MSEQPNDREESIKIELLSKLTGFGPELLKKELLIGEDVESISLSELREKMADYLNQTWEQFH